MSIIEIKGLYKQYRKKEQKNPWKNLFKPDYKTVQAVKNVNFSVEKGESVAFLGPNGAGKTTTIKMMTGLIFPSKGTIEIMGYRPYERKADFLRRIGLVMGNKNGLSWDLTPNQSLHLITNIYKLDPQFAKTRIAQLAELLDVTKLLDTPLRNMSLGERMKMELIGSIVHNPEILFLDEPTIGLDILTKKKVRLFLREIQKKEGTTLILTSHDIDDIEAVCDRVIVINKGEKCYDDSITSLVDKYQQNRYLRFVLDAPLSKGEIDHLAQWGALEKHDDESIDAKEAIYFFKTSIKNMVPLITHILTEKNVLDMQIESVPLEDVIADLFKKG